MTDKAHHMAPGEFDVAPVERADPPPLYSDRSKPTARGKMQYRDQPAGEAVTDDAVETDPLLKMEHSPHLRRSVEPQWQPQLQSNRVKRVGVPLSP